MTEAEERLDYFRRKTFVAPKLVSDSLNGAAHDMVERYYQKEQKRMAENSENKNPNEYYGRLTPQPIEYMHKALTKEQFSGYCLGNLLKYSLRFGHKDSTTKEAKKIADYGRWLAENEAGKELTF